MSHPTLKGLLPKSDRAWSQQHSTGKLFEPTYIDSSPSAWSQQLLGTCYPWTFHSISQDAFNMMTNS
eukprot:10835264-Ditylum_brightwellii.AAC.1